MKKIYYLLFIIYYLFQTNIYSQGTWSNFKYFNLSSGNFSGLVLNSAASNDTIYFPGLSNNSNIKFGGYAFGDTLYKIADANYTVSLGESFANFVIKQDTLYKYSFYSAGSANWFVKYKTTLTTGLATPTAGNFIIAGEIFAQNDTIFLPNTSYLASYVPDVWNNTYQAMPVINGKQYYFTYHYKFTSSEDIYFLMTKWGFGSYGVSTTTAGDTSYIYKRNSATGQLTQVVMLDDTLSWAGGLSGYISSSGDHILLAAVNSPKIFGGKVYEYNITTSTLTDLGQPADIQADSVVVNSVAITNNGQYWASVGNIYTADTTTSRIYNYRSGNWFKMSEQTSVGDLATVQGIAPLRLFVYGDSLITFFNNINYLSFDSVKSKQTSIAFAYFYLAPAINLTYPIGGEMFSYGDTVNITWTKNLIDTTLIYYSSDAGISWIFVDTSLGTSYQWTIPNIFTTKARIKIQDINNLASDESINSFTIFPSGAAINIIEPDTTVNTFLGNSLLIKFESVNVDTASFYYSKNGINFILITNNIPVSVGDGISPDTTSYWWNIGETILSTKTYFKVQTVGDSNIVLGNPNPNYAYYSQDSLVAVGKRAIQQKAQGVYRLSNFFISNDILFTVGYYAFVWGWYDYFDSYNIFYWDVPTQKWESVSTPSPGQAYYPSLQVYNTYPSSQYVTILIYNGGSSQNDHRSKYRTATWTAANPPVLVVGLSSEFINVQLPISNSYANDNDTTKINGWKYYLSGGSIRAKDITNLNETIDFTLINMGQVPSLDSLKLEIIGYDNKLFISNSGHKGTVDTYFNGVGIDANSVVYTIPLLPSPYLFAYDITSSTIFKQTRNYFRGIYPEAIIKITSGK